MLLTRTYRVLVLFLALGCYSSTTGCAQEAGDIAEAADQLKRGAYEEARASYRDIVDAAGTDSTRHTMAFFETYLAPGDYEEGLQEVERRLQRASDDPYLLSSKARLLAAVGRYEEAEATFIEAAQQKRNFWRNALELAELYDDTGQERRALGIYDPIYRQYKNGGFRVPDELGIAAKAAARLEEFHDANAAFRTAHQIDPEDVQNLYWWAELFREKYNDEDARRTYADALNINPNRADLYVGLARAGQGYGQQEQLAQKALEKNPNSVSARALLGELRIIDGLYDEAAGVLDEALAINPSYMPALAHLASVYFFQADSSAFAEVEQRALAVNPRPGGFYITLAENASNRFRYPDAVEFARKAVTVDRQNVRAYTTLGMSLLRIGETLEARRYLTASFDRDAFNLFVGNTLELLDGYENFDLLQSEHFELLIHQSESGVLGQAILEEAEACYAALTARYPYRPPGKIMIEAYNDQGDFGVRVAGIPHLSLLGVSFGDVVTINTPKAQGNQPYNWARTLWHELAHTMAIGVSEHKTPRWFTEGLSVYEERFARPEWGREMDLEFFGALDDGKLLPLANIDRGFTRPQFPGQIILSYYHASKVIAYIVEQHGFEAIIGILEALADGQMIDESIETVLRQDINSLDRDFQASTREARAQYARVLNDLPALLGEDDVPVDPLESLSGRSDNPFFQALQAGHDALQQADYNAAQRHFEEALQLYPEYIGPGNPYLGLDRLYTATNNTPGRMEILERYLALSEHGAEAARTLGTLYEEAGDVVRAVEYLDRSLDVDPYDLDTQARLAGLYERRANHQQAILHRKAVVSLNPVDLATAYYDLAHSLYEAHHIAEAKRATLQALELAPGYRDAQKLLLKCVDEPR